MKNIYIIVIMCFFLITISEVSQLLLETKTLLYQSLASDVASNEIQNIINFQNKWKLFGYVIMLIYVFLKTSIITLILYIAIFFSKSEITFKSIFYKVIQAEFIFLLVPIFKIIWFYFFQTSYKLEDIQNFFPLSAINITGYEGLEPWYIYPLQTLNLFEIAYIFYLGFQIAKLTKSTPDEGLKMVVFSYVPALLLWVCTIMFLTLNYS